MTFRREMSRDAAAASEEERQEEELQGEERQGEGMQGEGRPGEGLAVRDNDRRDAEMGKSGRVAKMRGEGRTEASGRMGGVEGVVVIRGRESIVIPAEEWYALRANRLTVSAFEKAVGFYPGGRQQLWEEKVGLRAPFAGNEATAWGQGREEEALMEYERLTGGRVEHRSFLVRVCVG
ncbi:unnamed protein product [Closterium sp. Yama58-4]|nr:unnamed protein product [Closterium sp. Yama58-4]